MERRNIKLSEYLAIVWFYVAHIPMLIHWCIDGHDFKKFMFCRSEKPNADDIIHAKELIKKYKWDV